LLRGSTASVGGDDRDDRGGEGDGDRGGCEFDDA
jgi:hypothetical protein